MDTIIYLYLKRNQNAIQPYCLERLYYDSYILLKVGLDRTWVENCKRPEEIPVISENAGQAFRKRREKKRLLRQRELAVREALRPIEHLWQTIFPLIDYPQESYLVYDEMLQRKEFPVLWQQVCPFLEFVDYNRDEWAKTLLPCTKHTDYLILGTSGLLSEFLRERGARMKSLKWIVPAAEYTDDIKQFEEDFLYEFGLAIDMQIIQEVREYRRCPISSGIPVNVVDFSGEEKLWITSLPEGSVWLDMDSSEGKQRRIEAANPQISYISLKKQWKQAKKESIVLDTISKNRYNT